MLLSARMRFIVVLVFTFCAVIAAALNLTPVSEASDENSIRTRFFDSIFVNSGGGWLKTGGLYAADGKIAPQVLTDTADGKRASVVILLADQADTSAAYEIKDQDARGWFVYNTLTEHAARTQADLRSFLNSRGIAHQSFWAANMLVAEVDRPLAIELAARSDVALIDSNNPSRWIEDPSIANQQPAASQPDVPNTVEWGVMNVKAPAVWALGFNGGGMVVGGLDTGIRWTHNAIKPKYRGWNGVTADHNFN